MNLADIRSDYIRGTLRRKSLAADPLDQFRLWLGEAREAGVKEPTAMSLATAGEGGRPRVRTVLLKMLDTRGFAFFTNLESRKGRELAENPAVCLLFPWLVLERQVIVTGAVSRVSDEEAFTYFSGRPRGSQLAAWTSRQSGEIPSRAALEGELAQVKERFGDGPVPLPPFWGGYRVAPSTIEFWQGGPDRLHDRFEYTALSDGSWHIQRLAP